MPDYVATALAEAHSRALTSEDIEALAGYPGYVLIADLAGVTIEPDGSSPSDFFYRKVQRRVGDALREEELQAVRETRIAALEAVLPSGVTVEIGPLGDLVIYDPDWPGAG